MTLHNLISPGEKVPKLSRIFCACIGSVGNETTSGLNYMCCLSDNRTKASVVLVTIVGIYYKLQSCNVYQCKCYLHLIALQSHFGKNFLYFPIDVTSEDVSA
jgi:hypothetical protein